MDHSVPKVRSTTRDGPPLRIRTEYRLTSVVPILTTLCTRNHCERCTSRLCTNCCNWPGCCMNGESADCTSPTSGKQPFWRLVASACASLNAVKPGASVPSTTEDAVQTLSAVLIGSAATYGARRL